MTAPQPVPVICNSKGVGRILPCPTYTIARDGVGIAGTGWAFNASNKIDII